MLIRQNFAKRAVSSPSKSFPPKTEPGWAKLQNTLRQFKAMEPAFVSVTCSAGGSGTEGIPTADVAAFLKNELQIEPLAHVTCLGNTREELQANLEHLFALGVRNIMCLRGDRNPDLPQYDDFLHASDMAAYIQKNLAASVCPAAAIPSTTPNLPASRRTWPI